MRRLKVMAVIVGLVMTSAGMNEFGLAYNHGTQVTMTLEEFLRKRPADRWVKLTDCRVAYQDLVYVNKVRKSYTTPEEVSVPVYTAGESGGTARMILIVSSSRSKEVVKDPSSKGVRLATIEGFVRSGSTFNSKLQRIAKWKPAPDCVIIDEGREPKVGAAVGLLGIGVAVLGVFAVGVMKRFTGGRSQTAFRVTAEELAQQIPGAFCFQCGRECAANPSEQQIWIIGNGNQLYCDKCSAKLGLDS